MCLSAVRAASPDSSEALSGQAQDGEACLPYTAVPQQTLDDEDQTESAENVNSIILSKSTPVPSPPLYEDDSSLPRGRFKVTPREEEGREELPEYTCSLHREAVLEQKMELTSPFERANKRCWKKCYLVLHGTLLTVYKPKKATRSGAEKRLKQGKQSERYVPGEKITHYTMQLAEVGAATDYKKRMFVIRLRVEKEQFLLAFKTEEESFLWLETFATSIDLSPSLDERSLPRYQTIPRRRRRRNAAQVVAEQEAIIRRDFPHLSDGLTPTPTPAAALAADLESADAISLILRRNPNSPMPPSRSHRREFTCFANRSELATYASARDRERARRRELERAPCFSEDGKWAPPSSVTPEANMRYVRRCMAVLCGDAPRQSDYVVIDGRRYHLLWEKKKMVRVDERESRMIDETGSATDSNGKGRAKEEKLPRLPEYQEVVSADEEEEITEVH